MHFGGFHGHFRTYFGVPIGVSWDFMGFWEHLRGFQESFREISGAFEVDLGKIQGNSSTFRILPG